MITRRLFLAGAAAIAAASAVPFGRESGFRLALAATEPLLDGSPTPPLILPIAIDDPIRGEAVWTAPRWTEPFRYVLMLRDETVLASWDYGCLISLRIGETFTVDWNLAHWFLKGDGTVPDTRKSRS